MSDNISTSWQRSSRAFPETYDGAEDFERALRGGLTPDPLMSVSEWADRHRVLSQRAASEPGRWRTSRTPYLKEIMDCLSPASPVNRVVFMKGSQVGGTECGNNWIGYVIHQAPGPMMAVAPTVELAKRNSKQRIEPQIEDSPVLRDRVKPSRSRDSGNTILSKEFPGGVLILTGANSAVGLRSMPARYLFLDEVDGYPGDVEGEGDPILLAERRASTFQRRKVLLVSTPKIKGLSRIEHEYEASDQRRYFVPCPECGEYQALRFECLVWPKGKPEQAAYCCEHCGSLIEEHCKTGMLEAGEWRPTAQKANTEGDESPDPDDIGSDGRTAGFHLSNLYSPVGWFSWGDAAALFEASKKNPELLKGFVNTVLGETWVETGEAPDWQRLYDRRERWSPGTVPAGGLFLTAGADVQQDRIEVDVWAWGRGLESWLIDHIVIEGGPERTEPWAELDRLLSQVWPHEGGAALGLARFAIDTRYEPIPVYTWARRAGKQVAPVNGNKSFNQSSPVSGPTYVDTSDDGKKLRRSVRRYSVAVSAFKIETYRFLRLERPTDEEHAGGKTYPPGTVHLPHWVEDEWLKQFVAEQLVTVRTRHGSPRHEWRKLRERNEALDCRVYARAAAWIAGADRFPERRWRRMEAALAGNTGPERAGTKDAAAPDPGSRPAGRRRVTRSKWMG